MPARGSKGRDKMMNHSKMLYVKDVKIIVLIMALLFTAFSSLTETQARTVIRTPELDMFATVDALIDNPPVDRKIVERVLKVKMVIVSKGDFYEYVHRNFHSEPRVFESAEFREPSTNGAAKSGPLLALQLGDSCIASSHVLAHYDGFFVADTPHGHSLDEETYFALQKPWGTLSFGFQERSPDCLRDIVFSVLGPGEVP